VSRIFRPGQCEGGVRPIEKALLNGDRAAEVKRIEVARGGREDLLIKAGGLLELSASVVPDRPLKQTLQRGWIHAATDFSGGPGRAAGAAVRTRSCQHCRRAFSNRSA